MNFAFDDELREVITESKDAETQLRTLLLAAENLTDPVERARALGEAGVYLRVSGRLDEAQVRLEESIRLLKLYADSPAALATQELRLAHVHQWKGDFERSGAMLTELLVRCTSDERLGALTDFVWQHSGKNYFDQRKFAPALLAFENALRLRMERGAPRDQVESSEHALRITKRKLGLTS